MLDLFFFATNKISYLKACFWFQINLVFFHDDFYVDKTRHIVLKKFSIVERNCVEFVTAVNCWIVVTI